MVVAKREAERAEGGGMGITARGKNYLLKVLRNPVKNYRKWGIIVDKRQEKNIESKEKVRKNKVDGNWIRKHFHMENFKNF